MIKVGFHLWEYDFWPTWNTYLRSLFEALRTTYPADLRLCCMPSNGRGDLSPELRGLVDETLVFPSYRRWTLNWAMDRAARRFFHRDHFQDLSLREHGVNVIVFGDAPRGSEIPTLGWLPDFQHVHLPEMFSAEERRERDRQWVRMAARKTRILLLSESVRRDFQAFAPQYAEKGRVVSPVSYVPHSIYGTDPRYICDVYSLPEKFIYLPNQFWKHKNHRAAFGALKLLKEQEFEVFLVCTGYPGDYRDTSHFSSLLQDLSRWKIRNQVAILGLVPREHVFALIRQSVCVLNPSLFEGYGMTLDEARSVGKQMLVSDIPAHREQDPPGGVYFDPKDHEGLAGKLRQIWRESQPGPAAKMEDEARRSLPERTRKCAEAFMTVVREVLSE